MVNFYDMTTSPEKLHGYNVPQKTVSTGGLSREQMYIESHLLNMKLHRVDGPALIIIDLGMEQTHEEWMLNGRRHRDGGPAVVYRDLEGNLQEAMWYKNGRRHRTGGPAKINITETGDRELTWYQNGELHNDDGPCEVTASGCYWRRRGELHRGDGLPAVMMFDDNNTSGWINLQWCDHGHPTKTARPGESGYAKRGGRWQERVRDPDGSLHFVDCDPPYGWIDIETFPLDPSEHRQRLESEGWDKL